MQQKNVNNFDIYISLRKKNLPQTPISAFFLPDFGIATRPRACFRLAAASTERPQKAGCRAGYSDIPPSRSFCR